MSQKTIRVGNIEIANDKPFVLFGGINVLESRDGHAGLRRVRVGDREARHSLRVRVSFGGHRPSITSFRGPGLEEGMKIFEEVADLRRLSSPMHEPRRRSPSRTSATSSSCRLSFRQTDLVVAMPRPARSTSRRRSSSRRRR
ncbi:hypothetical protein [Stutzerimonas xanthomarina]|uniref:hypothetical protein n=1 Tax=Stutzerimonas xanthomarina TaxID=271420 RepID=UPI003AA84ED6